MTRMNCIVFLTFALASVQAQAQGYQGGPGSQGLDGLNGNRPGPGIMGGDPLGPGLPFGRPGLPNLRDTPGNRDWWKPHGMPDEIKLPQINPESLRSLNPKFEGFPFSGSKSEKPKDGSSDWPAWVRWESALGLFVASLVIGLLIGRFGKPA